MNVSDKFKKSYHILFKKHSKVKFWEQKIDHVNEKKVLCKIGS